MLENLERPENRLLAALPVEEYQRLLPHLALVQLSPQQVLYQANNPIQYVYFPQRSLISLVALLEDGATLGVGLVGSEGMIGTAVFLGCETAPHQAVVQIANSAIRMQAAQLQEEFSRGGAFQALLLRYMQTLFIQVSQGALCNRRHHIEQRLARWLLLVADQIESDQFPLTHEAIALLLGIRRSGVSVAAEAIQQDKLIHYRRGQVRIMNRAELEAFSCECYRVIKTESARLLGDKA